MIDKTCKNCGKHLTEFYNDSLLGCPECYKEFSKELSLALKKLHGVIQHKGKSPKCGGVEHELLFEYRTLLEKKEQAMLNGKFTEVVKLGEEIKLLADELYRRGLK